MSSIGKPNFIFENAINSGPWLEAEEQSKLSAFLQESDSDLHITAASKMLPKSHCSFVPTSTLSFRNMHWCDNKGGKLGHDLAICRVSSTLEHSDLYRL